MRKNILICFLLIGGVLIMHTNAQTKTSFGIKLNGNMMNLKLTKMKDKNNSFEPGVAFGGFTKIEFSENFALQPELMLSYTEGKIKIGEEKVKYKYSTMEVPIYALGQFEVGSGKFFFGMGPIVGYGFDSDNADEKYKLGLNHWYWGGGVIVGYELQNGLTFHGGYQRTHDFRSESERRSNIETHTINLGMAYKF